MLASKQWLLTMTGRHTKTVCNAWKKFGIEVWPGAGIVGDRTLISDFTGKDASELGGFPVNSPDCMPNDQSVNNSWKNLVGGLYDTYRSRKPSRRTIGGFINDMKTSVEALSQEKIQNAIDLQRKPKSSCFILNHEIFFSGLLIVQHGILL